AVLPAPTQASFNVATLGPYLLMLTLGAAAFGAFVSLPAALGGGVVLGLVGQIVSAETSNASKGELAVFVAILLIILVRGRAISRVFASSGSAVPDRPVTRVPLALRDSALVRYERWWLALGGLTLAVTTLGFAVVAPDWLFRQPWFGSSNPFGVPVQQPRLGIGLGRPESELAIYYVALAVLVLAVLAGTALRRSMPGRLIIAVRDNERASAAFGI